MRQQGTEYDEVIRPLGDRILVRKCFVPDADEGKGLIILPKATRDQTNICVVLAIGDGVKHFTEDDCLDLEFVGDAVYVQGPGGKMGISEYIQGNPLSEDEFFIRERGLLPACKFVAGKMEALK